MLGYTVKGHIHLITYYLYCSYNCYFFTSFSSFESNVSFPSGSFPASALNHPSARFSLLFFSLLFFLFLRRRRAEEVTIIRKDLLRLLPTLYSIDNNSTDNNNRNHKNNKNKSKDKDKGKDKDMDKDKNTTNNKYQ